MSSVFSQSFLAVLKLYVDLFFSLCYTHTCNRKEVICVSNIENRIAIIVSEACGGNRSAFARRLGISAPYAAQLCAGQRLPSDRTISDICREFGVNETWLRSGAGEPFMPPSRSEEMGRLVKSLMADKPESFRSRLITALLRFDADGPEWQLLEDIYNSVAADVEKETDQ